ncbi:TPA: DUF1653 domain-containing protein [Candidatus Nomurabacteria bacterium]|nr:DUF1653 domain-containing protein [Candidatus Nomurabacteria bacterium]
MKGEKIELPEIYPKEGEVYKHFKGDYYKIKALALHSDLEIWMVVYEPMYENPDAPFFVRPLDEWYDMCDFEDVHEKVQRFSLVAP